MEAMLVFEEEPVGVNCGSGGDRGGSGGSRVGGVDRIAGCIS